MLNGSWIRSFVLGDPEKIPLVFSFGKECCLPWAFVVIGQPFWKMLKAPGSHSPWTMGGTATYHGSCQDCRLIVNILGYSRFLVHANGNQLIRNEDWSLQRTIDITHFFGVPFEQRNLFFHFRLQLWDSSSKTPPGNMEPEKWGFKDPWNVAVIWCYTSSTAQGGGGSFKNRKPIGEVGCCESGMVERSHWSTERCLISLALSLSFSDYLPTYLSMFYVSIDLSISLSLI